MTMKLPFLLITITTLWLGITMVLAHLGRTLPWSAGLWVALVAMPLGGAMLLSLVVFQTKALFALWVPIIVIGLWHWMSASFHDMDGMHGDGPDWTDQKPSTSVTGFQL